MLVKPKDTLKLCSFPFARYCCLALCVWVLGALPVHAEEALLPPDEYDDDQIEIIEGEDRLIYEYRQNGLLTMIKVVPRKGRPYYMVPGDGAPPFEGLDHQRKLYPQWVIIEW